MSATEFWGLWLLKQAALAFLESPAQSAVPLKDLPALWRVQDRFFDSIPDAFYVRFVKEAR